MSPVSRGRKGKPKKQSNRRQELPELIVGPADCDCPSCSGSELDPEQMIDDLIATATELVDSEDPLEAEVVGAAFASMGTLAGEGFAEMLILGFIPQFEARGSTESLALLLSISAVMPGLASEAAAAAAHRLAESGVARPPWADELAAPITVSDCWRLSDPEGTGSILAGSFQRAGRGHAMLVSVDHDECGEASDILLLPELGLLPDAVRAMRASGTAAGLGVREERLDHADFRWHVEKALDARAAHDGDLSDADQGEMLGDEDGPGYVPLSLLLRARMRALPAPSKPSPPHDSGCSGDLDVVDLTELAGGMLDHGTLGRSGRGRPAATALPAKRKGSDPPAPIYQLKIGLRGAKPPIWRRLEVPADITLARLHEIIQAAFAWEDSHLHVFETPYGSFGMPDAQLGHRSEATVTLEQVAPGVKAALRYTYDFGDDWEHDVVVEKVLDHDETVAYPRCVAGRRAAPPDDCGGIWGYANLVEILADPRHPEHEDRLDWLGLDKADDFDPGQFDAEAVTRALSKLR